jgi:hypothetical protein
MCSGSHKARLRSHSGTLAQASYFSFEARFLPSEQDFGSLRQVTVVGPFSWGLRVR